MPLKSMFDFQKWNEIEALMIFLIIFRFHVFLIPENGMMFYDVLSTGPLLEQDQVVEEC